MIMRKHRLFLTLCLIVIGFTACVFWRELSVELVAAVTSSSQIYCYWSRSTGIVELGQGEWDEPMLIPSRCIFFHDTTCSLPNLTLQRACAVESAARTNQNLNVFLLFFAPGRFSGQSEVLVKILETYDNVYIRRVRLSTYIIDTPIENWFSASVWKFSRDQVWWHRNFHDYMRMLTLWKFGGVALNLNSIVQTSLDELTTFVGVQNDRNQNVGVFGVDTSTDFGKKFIDVCMEIIKNINTNNYPKYNITKIIVETLQKLCYQERNKECQQFTIYPPAKFYPVYSWKDNINDTNARKIMQNAITIHLQDDYNQNTKTNMAIYEMLAKHCPKIYEFAVKNF